MRVSCSDEWRPLRGDNLSGFLKTIPDLSMMPATIVTSPDNLDEVNKRLDSEQPRINSVVKQRSLEALRDVVYSSGEETFHWNLRECIEWNGRFAKGLSSDDSDEEDEKDLGNVIPEMDLTYELNDLVATRINIQDEAVPFWIARVQEVVKNNSGSIVKLRVHWHELYRGKNAYKGKYAASYVGTGRGRKAWEETISVDTVLHRFKTFTRSKELAVADQKAIWQSLH